MQQLRATSGGNRMAGTALPVAPVALGPLGAPAAADDIAIDRRLLVI
jgi:hypothetical protein